MSTPDYKLPSYAAVRARLRVGTVAFHVRHTRQLNSLFAESVIVCPADDPQESVVALNGLLIGVAQVVRWDWLDPDSEDGDCIECWLMADDDTSLH